MVKNAVEKVEDELRAGAELFQDNMQSWGYLVYQGSTLRSMKRRVSSDTMDKLKAQEVIVEKTSERHICKCHPPCCPTRKQYILSEVEKSAEKVT